MSTGPLVSEHQEQLVRFLTDLSKKYYKDKPSNLTNYEYDVMYPEAIIWGIMKLDKEITYKKADLKYIKGIVRTDEEMVKQKCNEILNKQNKLNKSLTDASDVSARTEDYENLCLADLTKSVAAKVVNDEANGNGSINESDKLPEL